MPCSFLDPAKYPHGTRARYVTGCRCEECRRACREYARERTRKVHEASAEVKPNDLPPLWTTFYRTSRKGKRYEVTARACPGAEGRPCVKGGRGLRAWLHGAWLKNGGNVCIDCVARARVWCGLVDATPAMLHMRELAKKGVGYKSVADAANVGHPIAFGIFHGRRRTCRANVLRRILSVDEGAIADGALVPGDDVIAKLNELHERGFTWEWLSRELRCKARCGAALLVRPRATGMVLARTVLRIDKLYRRVVDGDLRPTRFFVDAAETWKLVAELRKGFTQKALAARLGISRVPLRDRRNRIHPRTAAAVKALHDELLATYREGGPLPEGWQTSANPVTPMGAEEWVKGGWSVARRTSKKAVAREKDEIRKLARGAA